MQTLSLDGFIVVTTPQEIAKIDAKRSINMILKLKVNVLGVVENFAGKMFGSGAGEEIAREMDLPFLGRLELREDYRDTSRPTVLNSKAVLSEYRSIAEQAKLALEKVAAGAA
jgi:ATP-binding protein involved in chromosome partitioning